MQAVPSRNLQMHGKSTSFCDLWIELLPRTGCLLAVLAAVSLRLFVRQNKDVMQSLLNGSDAARIVAFDDVHNLFRELQRPLFDDFFVFNDIDRNIVVDKAEHIEVEVVDRTLDFDDIFSAHFIGLRIFDDRDGAVQLIQSQIVIDRHGLAGLDVIENEAFFNCSYIQHGISFRIVLIPFIVLFQMTRTGMPGRYTGVFRQNGTCRAVSYARPSSVRIRAERI